MRISDIATAEQAYLVCAKAGELDRADFLDIWRALREQTLWQHRPEAAL